MELLLTLRKIRACEGEVTAQLLLERFVAEQRSIDVNNLQLIRAALIKALRDGQYISQVLEAAQKGLIQAGELVERSIQLVDKVIADAAISSIPKNRA